MSATPADLVAAARAARAACAAAGEVDPARAAALEAACERTQADLSAGVRQSLLNHLRYAGVSDEDAADVAQDKTPVIVGRLVAGQVGSGGLAGYLATCACHAARDLARSRRVRGLGDSPDPDELPSPAGLAPEERIDQERLLALVREGLADPAMPSGYREALVRVVVHGEDPAVLAAERGVGANTVHAWVSRGRRWLRRFVDRRTCAGRAGE